MEVYILDSLLRRSEVIDKFESLIWTERFASWGDFELHIFSTPEKRRLLPAGTLLSMSESYRVMKIEMVENAVDADGRAMLKLTGRSLEAILDDRTARNSFADLTTMPKWAVTGAPGDIARFVFDQICRTNANFPDDQIPFLKPGSAFPPGNIEEPDEPISVEFGLTSVYQVVKELCDAYDLGFRLVRNLDKSELYFDVYSGNDRTTLQNILDPVVFSPELDNLANVSSVTSIGNYKNVAYVFHPYAVQTVVANGVSIEVEGFDRRVLTVDASDIDVSPLEYVLTEDQTKAVQAGIDIAPNDVDKAALGKLLKKEWMTAGEATLVAKYASSTSPLNATQRTHVQGAINTYTPVKSVAQGILNTALQQRGRDELSKNRQVSAFDGELSLVNNMYPYEITYQLGDLVEMRNIDGVTNQMRVTEQIFVSDGEGERAYPTLTMDLYISPDTWFGWSFNETWSNADGHWGTS